MSHDFIEDLMLAVGRVVAPDTKRLREVLIVSGMPEKKENLRYLSYNYQVVTGTDRRLAFSAVAVINNRRIPHWRLQGYRKQLSRIVFCTRWTRNPLDLFLNNLRCSPDLMDLMFSVRADYSLMGILEVQLLTGADITPRTVDYVRPVLAIPGIGNSAMETVTAFENTNEIRRSGVRSIPFYSKSDRIASGE
ncbi:MAG: hypothetical protein ACOWWM_20160 [Desulfobacterales bacterium]